MPLGLTACRKALIIHRGGMQKPPGGYPGGGEIRGQISKRPHCTIKGTPCQAVYAGKFRTAGAGGRAEPSGGRAPRTGAPERAPPAPQPRAGRAERRRRRDRRPQRRAGGGGEAPQGRANGKAQSHGRGRRRGRPAAAAPPSGGRARGRPGPRRGPPGEARRFEAHEGAGVPRAGRRKRGPQGRAQQPRRGRRPTCAAEQRRAEALERSEKPSGPRRGPPAARPSRRRAASKAEDGCPRPPRVPEERSRTKRPWRSQCRAAERLPGGRPPGRASAMPLLDIWTLFRQSAGWHDTSGRIYQ